ncbi:hypothetical protein EDB85DRAFT_1263015 [Lactarius pseudohatsudake]|nr:hypothetical protein EDB85DRAFT_1263015 [Lactarius pseudohatsudake]
MSINTAGSATIGVEMVVARPLIEVFGAQRPFSVPCAIPYPLSRRRMVMTPATILPIVLPLFLTSLTTGLTVRHFLEVHPVHLVALTPTPSDSVTYVPVLMTPRGFNSPTSINPLVFQIFQVTVHATYRSHPGRVHCATDVKCIWSQTPRAATFLTASRQWSRCDLVNPWLRMARCRLDLRFRSFFTSFTYHKSPSVRQKTLLPTAGFYLIKLAGRNHEKWDV